MGGELPREKLDRIMSELRERLRQASEHAGMAREAASEADRERAEIVRPFRPSLHTSPAPPPGLHADTKPSASVPRGLETRPEPCPLPERLAPDMWADYLKRLASRLDSITLDAEGEFLAIGSHLHEFQQRALKISDISERVVRLINDKQIGRTITELDRILYRMKKWLAACPPGALPPSRLQNACAVVEKTVVCLDSLQKKHGLSAHMLSEFLDRSNHISRSIGSVVESLQYNDITRQHIEHVKGGLREAADRLSGAGLGRRTDGCQDFAPIAGDMARECARQAALLASAKEGLCAAVKAIKQNLSDVAGDAAEMSAEIHTVTKGDDQSGKSFLSSLGNSIGALTDTLAALCAEEARQDGPAAVRTSGGMPFRPAGRLPDEFARMVEDLRAMVSSLHLINGNILYRLSIVEEAGRTLSSEIEDAVGGITVHARVSVVADEVAAGLKAVAGEALEIAPDAMRYEKQADPRAAPRRKADTASGARVRREDALSRGDDELDDNVELF